MYDFPSPPPQFSRSADTDVIGATLVDKHESLHNSDIVHHHVHLFHRDV